MERIIHINPALYILVPGITGGLVDKNNFIILLPVVYQLQDKVLTHRQRLDLVESVSDMILWLGVYDPILPVPPGKMPRGDDQRLVVRSP